MKLGNFELNKIYAMDCLEGLKQLPDESVDLVVTSPPYNKHSANRKTNNSDSWTKANIDYGVYKDDMPENEYQEWQKNILRECLRVLKPDGSIFYNHKPRVVEHKVIFPHEWLMEFDIRQMIIWNRGSTPQIEPIRFFPTVEYIFWITKTKHPKFYRKDAMFKKVIWDFPPKPFKEHPAPFPIELPLNCIKATTDEGDIVLDPFMGSGTTAVACKQLNRNFIGFELNPEYVKLAEERLKKLPERLDKWS